jgi:hypothetical protein
LLGFFQFFLFLVLYSASVVKTNDTPSTILLCARVLVYRRCLTSQLQPRSLFSSS